MFYVCNPLEGFKYEKQRFFPIFSKIVQENLKVDATRSVIALTMPSRPDVNTEAAQPHQMWSCRWIGRGGW